MCHPNVEDDWVPQRVGQQEMETHSTSPLTRGVRHTQGRSHPTVCPTPIRDNMEDLTPLGVYTCFRPHHTLRWTLVHLKDPTPLRQRTGVVYWIPCSSCEKVYIGQTGRTLDHRLKEHRRALISGNVQQSAVAEHATNEMHDIDWEKAEVVDCHPHYRQRCALEVWHIRTEPHKMNRDGGPLPTVYNPLIHHPCRPC